MGGAEWCRTALSGTKSGGGGNPASGGSYKLVVPGVGAPMSFTGKVTGRCTKSVSLSKNSSTPSVDEGFFRGLGDGDLEGVYGLCRVVVFPEEGGGVPLVPANRTLF